MDIKNKYIKEYLLNNLREFFSELLPTIDNEYSIKILDIDIDSLKKILDDNFLCEDFFFKFTCQELKDKMVLCTLIYNFNDVTIMNSNILNVTRLAYNDIIIILDNEINKSNIEINKINNEKLLFIENILQNNADFATLFKMTEELQSSIKKN